MALYGGFLDPEASVGDVRIPGFSVRVILGLNCSEFFTSCVQQMPLRCKSLLSVLTAQHVSSGRKAQQQLLLEAGSFGAEV